MKAILLSGTCALVVSLFTTRWAISQFASWGLGQLIRDDGPQTHHVKRGTPTMGGAAIVVSVLIGYSSAKLLTWDLPSRSALLRASFCSSACLGRISSTTSSGSASMVFAAYTIIGIWQNNHLCGSASEANGLCSPAKIIMGDTGSLALGAS